MTDDTERYSYLGRKWGRKAERNVSKWDNQRHDTLLLALIEEVGEIAMAMEEHNRPVSGEPHPYVRSDDAPAHGRRLIHQMAELGHETRRFLESNYEEPAGSDDATGEYKLHGEPKDVEPILDEVEDAAPLCWQLYWSLQERSLQPDPDREAEFGDRLAGAVATMDGEAGELAARRPHPDANLYDIEEGLRQRSDDLENWLQEEYYR